MTLVSQSRRSASAGSSTTRASRTAPPASVSRDGVTSTSRPCRTTRPAGGTNTSPAPSPSLWTCSRQARSTSCPTSPTPRNAPKSCSFPRTPRAPNATTSTPGPTVTTWPRVTLKHSRVSPSVTTPVLCKPSSASSGSPTRESPAHTGSMTEAPFSLTRSQTARSTPSS